MIELWKSRFRHSFKHDRDFTLFIFVGIFVGVAGGINNTIFSNYLNDAYHLTASQRGFVELPRELPGMLIVLILGSLSFLGDIKIASIAMVVASLGMIGIGLFSPTFVFMIVWLIIYSLGTHMTMPLTPSIGMSLSNSEEYGSRLGQYSAWSLIATIFGYGIVWIGFSYLNMSYSIAFFIAGVFYIFAGITFTKMRNRRRELIKHNGEIEEKKPRKKINLVIRKRYTLFYVLSLINGGRKQIFLTFAPWVLIQSFGLGPEQFAILGVIVALISIGTRTMVGKGIDKLGERFVLSFEAIILIIICLGYVFAENLFPKSIAVLIMSACYAFDASMSVVEMARSTYVKKISLRPEDVTPTLSLGTSLDHIIAMTIPTLGGVLWAYTGHYQSVFVAAGIIACLNLILSSRIKIDKNLMI